MNGGANERNTAAHEAMGHRESVTTTRVEEEARATLPIEQTTTVTTTAASTLARIRFAAPPPPAIAASSNVHIRGEEGLNKKIREPQR